MVPVIYTDVRYVMRLADERPTAASLFESAAVLESAGGKLAEIADEIQAAKAAEYRAQANQLIKELDTERLETTEGARNTVERINARFNTPIKKLQGFVRACDAALKQYMAAKERKQREEREVLERAQREEQAAREAEAKELGVEPPPPPPPVVIPPSQNPFRLTGSHGASMGQRDNWKWRVTSIADVPESMLVPPEDRIIKPAMNSLAKAKAKAAIEAMNLGPNDERPKVLKGVIPGIELYNDPNLASSTL
jgi:hypothetical protein